MRRAEETINLTCPTAHALRHPQTLETSPEAAPSDPGALADEAEAGMWQAVLDHKARCVACDTLLQAQTHLTQLALTEGRSAIFATFAVWLAPMPLQGRWSTHHE